MSDLNKLKQVAEYWDEHIHDLAITTQPVGTIGFFQQYGITPATGGSGSVQAALENYLDGKMTIAEPCRESLKHAHHHPAEEDKA